MTDDLIKKSPCLYRKESDVCRMESERKCIHYDAGNCPIHGDLSNGKAVKTEYECQTNGFVFTQNMNGMGSF